MTVTRDPAEPREGLPPCLSMVSFEGRVAIYEAPCSEGDWHEVIWGDDGRLVQDPGRHPGVIFTDDNIRGEIMTDDPTEAKAAFERGAEYVRTGVLE